ncbi:hypothetical protein [Tenacibaculum finnmarkense]|uniref:hypothetical protein n=1 Tax=Tenacibaculum finnmarkense TaxID=2781243 RepID=UPI001E37EE81|nr:hypothetical protein [Tenacibaculum finnmarkense]MCD8403618.1 hypothetical protein [Tenacibaculum finnmarkense genomovar finnmarkense]MCG8239607.1 hypothetical protein [Tenacibaculum finnmarkense genomovar ulcerans]
MSRKLETTHLQVKSVKNASNLATDEKGNVIAGDEVKHNTSSSKTVVVLPSGSPYIIDSDFTTELDNKIFVSKEFCFFQIKGNTSLNIGASFQVITVNSALSFSFKGFFSRYGIGDQIKITRVSDTDYIVEKGMPITLFN